MRVHSQVNRDQQEAGAIPGRKSLADRLHSNEYPGNHGVDAGREQGNGQQLEEEGRFINRPGAEMAAVVKRSPPAVWQRRKRKAHRHQQETSRRVVFKKYRSSCPCPAGRLLHSA